MKSLAWWMWLTDFPASERALDASATPGDLAEALTGHFGRVDVLRPDAAALELVRNHAATEGWRPGQLETGALSAAPWSDGTFDCVALHDTLAVSGWDAARLLAGLEWCRALLRPGGWLALASPNPRLVARLRGTASGLPPGRVRRLLRRARFAEVRCFFIEPLIEYPICVIPDAYAASCAFESSEAVRGATTRARRATARLGMRSALYPGYYMLARA